MRYIHIKNGIVTNIVEYPDTPPELTDEGEDVVLSSGLENVGDIHSYSDNKLIKKQINDIEKGQNRTIREAILGDNLAIQRLDNINKQIIDLRKLLK